MRKRPSLAVRRLEPGEGLGGLGSDTCFTPSPIYHCFLSNEIRGWAKGKVPSPRGTPQISPGKQGPTTREANAPQGRPSPLRIQPNKFGIEPRDIQHALSVEYPLLVVEASPTPKWVRPEQPTPCS